MVKVTDFKTITNRDGEQFHALVVTGGVQPVKSQRTGRIYFTTRTATVPTTFDEETCKGVIGTSFDGNVERVECEPYEYAIEDTGEVIELSHRWEFLDETLEMLEKHLVNENEKIN